MFKTYSVLLLIALTISGCHKESHHKEIEINGEIDIEEPNPNFDPKGSSLHTYLIPSSCGHYVRINKTGSIKFNAVHFDNGPDYYVNGLARFIGKNGKVGFHDDQGKVVIEPKYNFARAFMDSMKPSKYSIVCIGCWTETKKRVKFKPLFDHYPLCEDNPNFNKFNQAGWDPYINKIVGGKYGAIDTTGKVVIPIKYDSIEEAQKKLESFVKNKR